MARLNPRPFLPGRVFTIILLIGGLVGKKLNKRLRLLVVIVTKANVSDQAGLKQLLAALKGELARLTLIKADEGYRGKDFIARVMATYQRVLEVVERPEGVEGFQVLPQRWVLGRTSARLGNYRRSTKDYEALPETSESFIYLATVDITTKRSAGCGTPAFADR